MWIPSVCPVGYTRIYTVDYIPWITFIYPVGNRNTYSVPTRYITFPTTCNPQDIILVAHGIPSLSWKRLGNTKTYVLLEIQRLTYSVFL